MELIWKDALRLANNDIAKALLIATGATSTTQRLDETRAEFVAAMGGVPSKTMGFGWLSGYDKPQHFFMLAYIAYITNDPYVPTLAGLVNEHIQSLIPLPKWQQSAYDPADIVANMMGTQFGLMLARGGGVSIKRYLQPNVQLKTGPVAPHPPTRGTSSSGTGSGRNRAGAGGTGFGSSSSSGTGAVTPDPSGGPDDSDSSSPGGGSSGDNGEEDFEAWWQPSETDDSETDETDLFEDSDDAGYVPAEWITADPVDLEKGLAAALRKYWSNRTPAPEMDSSPVVLELDATRLPGYGHVDPLPDPPGIAFIGGTIYAKPHPEYDPRLRPSGPNEVDTPDAVGPVSGDAPDE